MWRDIEEPLGKSAMSDSLGDGEGNATDAQMRLYERWAEGGTALSLIGEVQADPRYPEQPGNLVLAPDADVQAMQVLARRGSANGAEIWPQLRPCRGTVTCPDQSAHGTVCAGYRGTPMRRNVT